MSLTAEAVLALAPDDASAKAARSLVSASTWPTLGANDAAVWGECQGSGSKPYQTQVDLNGPAFRCSCPSRKFPCKHGLALLLLRAADASRFAGGHAPAWVSEWLSSRAEKAEKKEQKAQVAATAPPADPEAAARRVRQRWARMKSAGEELQRWLGDQVSRGLGALGEPQRAEWKTMAARLVDMQVPGLAQHLLEAAATIGQGAHWPERLLHRFGLLQLACDALARSEHLVPAMQADLRVVLGWPLDKADVLAEGQTLRDRWLVLGQVSEERDDRLTERRVWLQGETSGRRALLLDHAFAGKGFEQSWLTGQSCDATLAFFPGASAMRALAIELHAAPVAALPACGSVADEWAGLARGVAAWPFTPLFPLLLDEAVPWHGDGRLHLRVGEQILPLAVSDNDGWRLLAHSGGRGLQVMGEWDGRALRPLSAWNAEGVWQQQDSAAAAANDASPAGVWAGVLPAAMVGTARQGRWSMPGLPAAVSALVAEIDATGGDDAAPRLLRGAAVLAAGSLAGAQGAPAGTALPAPAPADAREPLPPGPAMLLFDWGLRQGPARLQHEVLSRVATAGWRVPTALLPTLLDIGRRSLALRPAVTAALGERGVWLARQHDEWRYASGASADASDEERWQHGSAEQRRDVLREQRCHAPAAARERLAAELPNLPARERAEILGALAQGLSGDDEPLLASLLEDRSKEVRQVATGLLVALPQSAFARQAAARLAPLLQQERALLRTRWAVEAPNEADKAWERAGIELTRFKHESLGERAWWLYQLARQVPLAWWNQHTGLSAEELLKWAAKTDWTEALLRAWRDVLLATGNVEWCEAMLDGWPWKGLVDDPARLLALLPLARRERHWQRQLTQGRSGALQTLLPQLLGACPPGEMVSQALSDQLAKAMRTALADANIAYDYSLRAALPELCCVLQLPALDALAGLPRRGDETPAHAEALHTMAQVIAARRALSQLPSSHTA